MPRQTGDAARVLHQLPGLDIEVERGAPGMLVDFSVAIVVIAIVIPVVPAVTGGADRVATFEPIPLGRHEVAVTDVIRARRAQCDRVDAGRTGGTRRDAIVDGAERQRDADVVRIVRQRGSAVAGPSVVLVAVDASEEQGTRECEHRELELHAPTITPTEVAVHRYLAAPLRYRPRMSILDGLDVDHLSKVAGPLQDMLSSGGVHDVLDKLHAGGLGDKVQSWVGKAKNIPISADQVTSVLGNDTVKSIAAKAGIPTDKVAAAIAHLLPHAVDKMTPDGKLPPKDAKVPDVAEIIKNMQAATALLPKK